MKMEAFVCPPCGRQGVYGGGEEKIDGERLVSRLQLGLGRDRGASMLPQQ